MLCAEDWVPWAERPSPCNLLLTVLGRAVPCRPTQAAAKPHIANMLTSRYAVNTLWVSAKIGYWGTDGGAVIKMMLERLKAQVGGHWAGLNILKAGTHNHRCVLRVYCKCTRGSSSSWMQLGLGPSSGRRLCLHAAAGA